MPKNLRLNLYRLIKATKGRFFSLVAIVTLGVAFFVGVSATSPVMGRSVDKYDDEMHLKDITIYSNYGFDEADVEALKEIDDIWKIEATQFKDVIAYDKDESFVTRVHSYDPKDFINHFILREGRFPQNPNEALAEKGTVLMPGFAIDKEIQFDIQDEESNLTIDHVKIVGTIDTPMYLNQVKENSTLSNQVIKTYLYVPKDAFKQEYQTEINIIVDKAEEKYSFSNAYEEAVDIVKLRIESFAESQQEVRYNRLKKEAEEEYADGLKEYEDGQKEYNEEIAKAEQDIKDAEQEIIDGKDEIEKGKQELIDAQKELDQKSKDGQKEIDDGRAQIEKTKKELQAQLNTLTEQEKPLQDGLAKVNDGLAQLDTGITQLEEAQRGLTQIDSGIQQLENAISQINQISFPSSLDPKTPISIIFEQNPSLKSQLLQLGIQLSDNTTIQDVLNQKNGIVNNYQSQMSDLKNQRNGIYSSLSISSSDELNQKLLNLKAQRNDLQNQYNDLKDNEQKLIDGKNQINQGLMTIAQKEKELEDGQKTLDESVKDGQAKIDDGWKEIAENEEKIKDGEEELKEAKIDFEKAKVDGQKELDDAKEELQDARKQIDEMEDPEWTILDRSMHYATASYTNTVNQMEAIGQLFPFFFIFVAALVCLTTMTRLVQEERGEIGILRALGFSKIQCALKYLLYAGLATLVGVVVGTIGGMLVFPTVIYHTWKMMYILPDIYLYIPWSLILTTGTVFLCVMLGVTYYACQSDMKEVPAQLLRPKAPKLGKNTLLERIPFLWEKMSFTWKVTSRNIFRYKRRFIMTVAGVAGCTALLVTGFGIADSINAMVDKQFYEIYQYDGFVELKEEGKDSEKVIQEIKERNDVEDAYLVGGYYAEVKANHQSQTTQVQVYNDPSIANDYYLLRTRKKHQPLEIKDEGVIINEKLAELFDLQINDVLLLESFDGVSKECKITGINEMYVQHHIFMSQTYYESIFGKQMEDNTIMIRAKEGSDLPELQKYLVNHSDIKGISFFDSSLASFNDMVKGLDYVVWTLIASSMALAFVVLGNLINVNIAERKREIATLKVLGFRKNEVKSYIYKENNILTILGAFAGMPLGTILHHFIMRTVEMEYVMFGRDVFLSSYLFAFALTIFFGLLINHFMRHKLSEITMVESLKSVE